MRSAMSCSAIQAGAKTAKAPLLIVARRAPVPTTLGDQPPDEQQPNRERGNEGEQRQSGIVVADVGPIWLPHRR